MLYTRKFPVQIEVKSENCLPLFVPVSFLSPRLILSHLKYCSKFSFWVLPGQGTSNYIVAPTLASFPPMNISFPIDINFTLSPLLTIITLLVTPLTIFSPFSIPPASFLPTPLPLLLPYSMSITIFLSLFPSLLQPLPPLTPQLPIFVLVHFIIFPSLGRKVGYVRKLKAAAVGCIYLWRQEWHKQPLITLTQAYTCYLISCGTYNRGSGSDIVI